jgi:sister chromatid cohesion protein PDS5
MPPRVGAAAGDDDDVNGQLIALQFSDTLSWRAGRPIATGELHRRLNRLAQELADLDQETTDKDSLTKAAKELAAQPLLAHKDKGVKAFVACCLVDILRICAPHAPFTEAQLRVSWYPFSSSRSY